MSIFRLVHHADQEDKKFLVVCDCTDIDHSLEITWYPVDIKPVEMYIKPRLRLRHGFPHRLWQGIRYLFQRKNDFGIYTEMVLFERDIVELSRILDEYLEDARREDEPGKEGSV